MGTSAGSGSGRTCAGSAATEDWGETAAAPAAAPSAGRTMERLCREAVGCTPGALETTENK